MKTKVCTKCKIRKLKTKFSKTHISKDGLYPQCKKCTSKYHKEHYQKNRQKILNKTKEYRNNNKEKVLETKRKEYQKHKDKYIKNSKKWVKNNRKQSNKIKYRYKVKKLKIDPTYRAIENLRKRIRAVLLGHNKSKATRELLGCSHKKFILHIQKQFTEDMGWDNYGYYGWHIDHIKPCASFDLSDPEQQKQCFHYTNLQPLWAKDNLSKSDKF